MKSCPRCMGLSPDTAQSCQHCGTVLDESVIARAGAPSPGRANTVVEPSQAPPGRAPTLDLRPSPPPPLPSPPPAAGRPARRGHTVYMPPNAVEPSPGTSVETAAAPYASARRVVGVLVTYSWKPEGQLFPVREGRNLIGRGEDCDIRIADDPMLSEVNSHITFRQTFVLGDMVSMSGTDLNDEPVEEQFRPLGNHARIRTGSTHWHFVIIDPAVLSRMK